MVFNKVDNLIASLFLQKIALMCRIVSDGIVDDAVGLSVILSFHSFRIRIASEKVSHRRSNKIDSLRLEDFSASRLPLSYSFSFISISY